MKFSELQRGDRFCFGPVKNENEHMKIKIHEHVFRQSPVNHVDLTDGWVSICDEDVEVTKLE